MAKIEQTNRPRIPTEILLEYRSLLQQAQVLQERATALIRGVVAGAGYPPLSDGAWQIDADGYLTKMAPSSDERNGD